MGNLSFFSWILSQFLSLLCSILIYIRQGFRIFDCKDKAPTLFSQYIIHIVSVILCFFTIFKLYLNPHIMRTKFLLITAFLFVGSIASAQEESDMVKDKDGNFVNETTTVATPNNIGVVQVKDSIFMLTGRGGNIGISVGEDGVFMIDNQFAKASPHILRRIQNISSKPIEILVNTHHHGDHVGGNSNIAELGTLIFSHVNARKRMETAIIGSTPEEEHQRKVDSIVNIYGDKIQTEEQRKDATITAEKTIKEMNSKMVPDGALPVVSFSRDLTFNYNGEEIKVIHLMNAHTDGDVMIYFTESNVLHTGDAFFNGAYPLIDTESNGSLKGYVGGLQQILKVANEETKIIPGHGEVATIADVKYTVGMFKYLSAQVEYNVVAQKTEAEVMDMRNLTKEYDEKGFGDGYVTTEKFLKTLYNELAKRHQK